MSEIKIVCSVSHLPFKDCVLRRTPIKISNMKHKDFCYIVGTIIKQQSGDNDVKN